MRKDLVEILKIHTNKTKDINFQTADDILSLYDDEIKIGTHPKDALSKSLEAIGELKSENETQFDNLIFQAFFYLTDDGNKVYDIKLLREQIEAKILELENPNL